MKASENPTSSACSAPTASSARAIGLTNDWVVNIIKARRQLRRDLRAQVGAGSPLKIERGLNALWNKGGLQYAPPIR